MKGGAGWLPRGPCLVLAMLAAAPGPGAASTQDVSTTSREVAGIRTIHRSTPGKDVVSVRLYLLGGAQQLTEETQGIEALLLYALDHRSRPGIEAAGGRPIVEIAQDWSVTGFQTLPEHFGEVWEAWAGGIAEPTLTRSDVGAAVASLTGEARRRYSDPEDLVRRGAWQSMFSGHPYSLDPLGTLRSLQGLGPADVDAYRRAHLVRSRMLLVVVGDVAPEELARRVEAGLGTIPPGDYAWTPPPAVQLRENEWRVQERDLPTNYIQGYILGPPPGDPDYFAFEVATNLLSGKLFDEVRNVRSLSYAAHASFVESAVPTAAIYASSRDPARVYDLLIEQLEWIQTLARVPAWVMNRYLEGFTLDNLAQNLTADGQAAALGRAEILFGDHRVADSYLDGIGRVRPQDIRRVAIEYMRSMQLAYLGDVDRLTR